MLSRRGAYVRIWAVGLLLACGGDSSGPDGDQPGAATALVAISGGTQTGVVGGTLAQPIVVKVSDSKGRAIPGVAVNFRIDSGNGTLAPTVATTDASGQAQTTWTLGTNSTVPQLAIASVATVATTVSFTATAQAGPAALVEKITEVGCAMPGGSGARDVIVRLTDTYGNPVSQGRVDWVAAGGGSVSPTSSNTGADGRATTRWTAGNTGDQSVTATVAALPAAVFSAQIATSRTMNRGEVLTLTSDAMRCNDFAAGGGARYLVAVTNITPNTSSSTFSFNGGLSSAASSTVSQIDLRSNSLRLRTAEGQEAQRAAAVHQKVLEANASFIRNASAAAPGLRPSSNLLSTSAPPPNVGDTLNMRVPNLGTGSCTVPKDSVRARVVYVGTRGVVMEDVAAPLTGTMDDLYRQIGQEYDNVMWGILNTNFGSPTAFDASLDANDRIFMLFTKHVNDMGAAGFVSSADFYPRIGSGGRPGCRISNVGEVFYAGVPLTTGGFSDPDSKDNFLRRTRTVIIHEAKHLVAYAHRFQRANGAPVASDLEDSWLEEAGAMVAEELWARTVYGYAQRSNATYRASLYCEVRPSGWPECGPDVKPRAMFDHFGFLYEYQLEIERRTPLGQTDSDDFSWYGSSWSLLRHAIDHSGVAEDVFLKTLTQEVSIHGVQNLQARSGIAFPDLVTDWTLTLALDDRPGFTASRPQLTQPSWNLNNIFAGLFADFGNQGILQNPMAVRNVPFGNFAVNVAALRGGTMAVFEITGTQSGRQMLELRTTTPGNLRLTFVRLD